MPTPIVSAQDGPRMTTTIRPGSIPSGAGRGKFPITSQKSVQSAARLIGHAKGVSKKRVAKHIIAAAKAKGLKVPPSVKAKARGASLSNAAAIDTDLAGKWRHGWIPLDATAMLVKAKKYKPGGSEKSRVPSHALPSGPGRSKQQPRTIIRQGNLGAADYRKKINAELLKKSPAKTGPQAAAEAFKAQKSGMHSLTEQSHAKHVAGLHRAAAESFRQAGDHRNAKMHEDLASGVEKIARDANTPPKSGEGRKSGVGTMKVKAKAPSKDTAAKQAARDEMTNRLDPKAPRHILSGELSGSQKAKNFKPGEHVTFHAGDAGQFRRGHIISASNSHVTIHSTHPTTGASEYHTYPTDHRGNLVPRPVEHNTLADKQYIAKQLAQQQARDARVETNLPPRKSLSEHFAGMKRMSPEAAKAAQKKAAESNVRFTQDAKDLAARINTSLENASAYSVTAEAMNRAAFAVGDRVALPTGSHTIVGLSKNGNMKLKHDTSGEIVRAPVGKARLVAKASERAKAATAK